MKTYIAPQAFYLPSDEISFYFYKIPSPCTKARTVAWNDTVMEHSSQ